MIEGAKRIVIQARGLGFSAFEMGEGPLVLCIHGFPDTPASFRLLLPALAGAGYRAVAVTLRGYEASSIEATGDYSLANLAQDVRAWVDALGGAKTHLIGHDWGANITYAAAALCPDRIGKIVTMAVPHPTAFGAALMGDYQQMKRSWYVYLFQLRGAAEVIAAANSFAFLKQLWRDWSPAWDDTQSLSAMEASLATPGALTAALDYYRTAFDAAHPRAAESQALLSSAIAAPTLGICGARDGCISADIFESAMPAALFSGGVRTVRIAEAGHFVHLEKPIETHREILAHLK